MVRFPHCYGKIIFHYIDREVGRQTPVSLSIHPPMDTGCFHILVFVINAALNMRMQVSFQVSVFISFEYSPRSGVLAIGYDRSFDLSFSHWIILQFNLPGQTLFWR